MLEHKATYIVSLKGHDLFDVLFDGEIIVKNSRTPFSAACRALVAKGITGRLLMYNQRGLLCLMGDITKASKLTVREDKDGNGPRFVKFEPNTNPHIRKP